MFSPPPWIKGIFYVYHAIFRSLILRMVFRKTEDIKVTRKTGRIQFRTKMYLDFNHLGLSCEQNVADNTELLKQCLFLLPNRSGSVSDCRTWL